MEYDKTRSIFVGNLPFDVEVRLAGLCLPITYVVHAYSALSPELLTHTHPCVVLSVAL